MNSTTLKYRIKITLQPVGDICPFGSSIPFTVMTAITDRTILTGFVGNILVLQFTREELKASPSAYLVFLMNMSVNNLTGIIISMPLFFVDFYTDLFRNIQAFAVGQRPVFYQSILAVQLPWSRYAHVSSDELYDRSRSIHETSFRKKSHVSSSK
jgi:hypothetical protein